MLRFGKLMVAWRTRKQEGESSVDRRITVRPLDELLDRVRNGCGVNRDEALTLFQEAPLAVLLEAASAVREQGKGKTISFSKKVFIPLTTLCRDYCGYCTFRKDPGQPGAHFMTPEEVLALAEK
jgi:2-iminoacetate synthase ThiH